MRLEGAHTSIHSQAHATDPPDPDVPSTPRADACRRWLCDDRVVPADGKVLSWYNTTHPGFPYPEASALWLSWAAWRREVKLPGPPSPQVERVAQGLETSLLTRGALGRDGHDYLFDSCLAVHGLARTARTLGIDPSGGRPLSRHAHGLQRFLEADATVLPRHVPERWSHQWNVHLSRAAALLLQAGRWQQDRIIVQLAHGMLQRTARAWTGGPPYLHALLYQAEGRQLLAALDEPTDLSASAALAAQLAELQHANGLLPSWADGSGPCRCDTTAQAVRLWALTDPRTYQRPMQCALTALAELQQPEGGLVYEPGSQDVNCWVTLFTDQATNWAQHGADPLALL